MQKFFIKYTLLIFVNLLAFLLVWHILDVLFWGGAKFKITFLLISIVPLLVVWGKMIQKSIKNLEEISVAKDNGK